MNSMSSDDPIKGAKKHSDGSQSFKCHGGPYNGMTFRLYPPYEPVHFKRSGTFDACTYEVHEPIRKGGRHILSHSVRLQEVMHG
jgi:hypothetical protein